MDFRQHRVPLHDDLSHVLETAQHFADEVLFPAAVATDAAGSLPIKQLDALADAGFYGLTGPVSKGGMDADFLTTCAVSEILASGCLTTAFVWNQHLGVPGAVARSDNPAVRRWLAPLCTGEVRAGVALAGALAGKPGLRATSSSDGWTFAGTAPFVSGWGGVDVLHTAAATEDGRLVWALLDASADTITVTGLDLVALNATRTVRLHFQNHTVPTERVTAVTSLIEGSTPPETMRKHASLALGVTRRCCILLGPTPLDMELAEIRTELDRLDPITIEEARGAAGALAMKAATILAVTTGSRSLLADNHAQLIVRNALFVLTYALRPGSRYTALRRLSGAPFER